MGRGAACSFADGLSTIQAVQVCEGVTKLGAFAFNNAGSAYYTGLTSITLPDSLQEVGAALSMAARPFPASR